MDLLWHYIFIFTILNSTCNFKDYGKLIVYILWVFVQYYVYNIVPVYTVLYILGFIKLHCDFQIQRLLPVGRVLTQVCR